MPSLRPARDEFNNRDIARLKARMGWKMPWYTITDSFDTDFGVDEWHGHNAFIREGDKVFHTWGTTWSYLDITPLGRQESWEDSPKGLDFGKQETGCIMG
jgi:predicted dithiol-disulfide oxidoreductase (DUF899 family)